MAGFYLHGLLNLLEERKSTKSGQNELNPDSGNEDLSVQPSSVKYSPMVITLLKD
jgi:hypothetical protein